MRALSSLRTNTVAEPANPPGIDCPGPVEGTVFGDYNIVVHKSSSIIDSSDPTDYFSGAGSLDPLMIPGSTPPIQHHRSYDKNTKKFPFTRKDQGALWNRESPTIPSQGLAKSEMVRSNSLRRIPKSVPMSRSASSRGSQH